MSNGIEVKHEGPFHNSESESSEYKAIVYENGVAVPDFDFKYNEDFPREEAEKIAIKEYIKATRGDPK